MLFEKHPLMAPLGPEGHGPFKAPWARGPEGLGPVKPPLGPKGLGLHVQPWDPCLPPGTNLFGFRAFNFGFRPISLA